MTLKRILEECYSLDFTKTKFAFEGGENHDDVDTFLRSIGENEIVIESLSDEHPYLEIDDIEVDDLSNRLRIFVI